MPSVLTLTQDGKEFMKKSVVWIISIVCLLLIHFNVFAYAADQDKLVFNHEKANQQFDAIQKKLEMKNDYASIILYVNKISDLQDDAKKCVSNSESHLKMINELLKSTQIDHVSQLQQADSDYLKSKQLYYAKELSECRLFLYRSQELIGNYREKIQELGTNQILKRNSPIWKLHEDNVITTLRDINYDKMMMGTGVALLTYYQWWIGLSLLILSLIVAYYIRSMLQKTISHIKETQAHLSGLLEVASTFILPLVLFGFISAFFYYAFQEISPAPTISLISRAFFTFTAVLAMVRILFYPSYYSLGLFSLPSEFGRALSRRITALLIIWLVGYLFFILFREQLLPLSLLELVRTVSITLVCGIVIWICLLWRESARFLRTTMIVVLSAMIVLEWLGYHRLTLFIFFGLFSTTIYTMLLMVAWRAINTLYRLADDKEYAIARKIHWIFGIKFNKKMREMILIRIAMHFTALCIYFVFIMKSWSVSPVFVDSVIDGLVDGFKFFGITIVPLRLLFALLSFSILLLIGRFIATRIAHKYRYKAEEDTQVAISTITVYISFSLAFLFAMLVTGVDFTGLAIIAGALSVGVGLGLQTIVNNFVSGLILLIEKPIRPGDRIVIGKTEGFVRKIRIRSTQIATLSKEDVIVPNADLITQQVTNYMFRDRNSRVLCEVGVAYGSDTQLVKKVLLDIAATHPEVIHESPNEPVVIFKSFGDSALIFNLWCVIHDVNKKMQVVSDLNFEIEAAFRQHQIVIAFPQREIHIKTSVQS